MKLNLLTTGNPKTQKGLKHGYLTAILHLSPANLSGAEMCQWRTKGCTADCLNLAGRGGINKQDETTNTIQQARLRRTRLFTDNRNEFMLRLMLDIRKLRKYASENNLKLAVRLNGTSDIAWENIGLADDFTSTWYVNIMARFPDVQFYDYTKAPFGARGHDVPNYHLTFSYAETMANHLNAVTWLKNGHNVAIPFATKKQESIPSAFHLEHWGPTPTINGDDTDLRFLDDCSGYVVALTVKGNSWKRNQATGFVVPVA